MMETAANSGDQPGRRTARVEVDEGIWLDCAVPAELAIHDGDQCIIEHDRIQELGHVIKLSSVEGGNSRGTAGHVLRCATLQDQAKAKENAVMSKMALRTCEAKAKGRGLDIQFVRVRYSFDRGILIVMFVSEERVDLQDLTGDLATELHARIDLREIGVRDEAGIIGGMGPCGREMCCCTFLERFESVNVRMAKVQGISLNPSAISGMCGRLKCCLRYEFDQYREADRIVPREGATVECPAGRGQVVERDVLRRRVKVRLDGDHLVEYDAEEVKKAWGGDPKKEKEQETEKEKEEVPPDEDPGA